MNFDHIKRILTPYDRESPGCAIAIVHNGKSIFSQVRGYADLEDSTLVSEYTNFRLASATKQFTAVGILLLIQDGRLSLNDTLSRFFPDFPEYGKNITVYQLLTHSSGLKDYGDLLDKEQSGQIHDQGVLALLKIQKETLFPSGTAYSYSDGGYCLLRLIIENVSKQSIDVFFKERLFVPLGMDSTSVNFEGKTMIANRAYGYSQISNDEWSRTDQDATSATIGDGGLYSSIKDLQKWDRVLYTDIVLTKTLRDLMLKKHILTDEGENIYYGFGLFLKEQNGKNIAYHGGSSIGFQTGIYYVLDEQFTTIFLSNRTGEQGSNTAEEIADLS